MSIVTSEDYGILITGTTKYFVIQGCYFETGRYGIFIDNVAENTTTVVNNTFYGNDYCGLRIEDSGGCKVTYNTFSNNYYGLSTYWCHYSIISNNTILNQQGLYIFLQYPHLE